MNHSITHPSRERGLYHSENAFDMKDTAIIKLEIFKWLGSSG